MGTVVGTTMRMRCTSRLPPLLPLTPLSLTPLTLMSPRTLVILRTDWPSLSHLPLQQVEEESRGTFWRRRRGPGNATSAGKRAMSFGTARPRTSSVSSVGPTTSLPAVPSARFASRASDGATPNEWVVKSFFYIIFFFKVEMSSMDIPLIPFMWLRTVRNGVGASTAPTAGPWPTPPWSVRGSGDATK